MRKFGLKLWSNNSTYCREAAKLYEENAFNYIELYAVPDSYDMTIKEWKAFKAPFLIHAPHSVGHDVNLAIPEKKEKNMVLLKDTFRFADELGAKYIIFHAGTSGKIEETAIQLKPVADKRTLIENKPYLAMDGKNICTGNSPEEINYIMEKDGIGFCLDIGHAICSANSHKVDPIEYLKRFLALKPVMFHLTDGAYKSEIDSHEHFGGGDYPMKKLLSLLPDDCSITIEAVKKSDRGLSEFAKDVEYLKALS